MPRTDLKQIDEWGIFRSEDLGSALRNSLVEIFSLPFASDVEYPYVNDLALDIVIPKYQSGDAWSVDLDIVGFPVFWRPKIEVRSRLYNLKTDKTKSILSVTEKMKWKRYFSGLFSMRGLFRYRPIFGKEEMDYLLYQACIKLLEKTKKAV